MAMKPQLTSAHPKRYSPALRRVGVSVRADAFFKAPDSDLPFSFCGPFHFCSGFSEVRLALRHTKARPSTANDQSTRRRASIKESRNLAKGSEPSRLAFQFA